MRLLRASPFPEPVPLVLWYLKALAIVPNNDFFFHVLFLNIRPGAYHAVLDGERTEGRLSYKLIQVRYLPA
jgi:hypothetical protein